MEELIAQLLPNRDFRPYGDDDKRTAMAYHPNQLVRIQITGARKARAYRELCCFKGSAKYIADQAINKNLDTPEKVEEFTKIKLGFIRGTLVDPYGGVQFLTKSLSYATCDQPEAHSFISRALEEHAALVGMDSADQYVAHLRSLGQGYDGVQ